MRKIWRGRFFRYTPLVLWTGVILGFSAGGASMNRTSKIIRPILEFLLPDASEETFIVLHAMIRKAAHFTEYAILAGLAWLAFKSSSRTILSARPKVAALAMALIVASADELYQSFDPSRTGTLYDVAIDLSGATVALLLIFLAVRRSEN